MPKSMRIYKQLGETPLEATERFRQEIMRKEPRHAEFWRTTPLTYAGRLDPLAEGELLILIGDECKKKDEYLGLDKEYEIEIMFGLSTDSHDSLGLATRTPYNPAASGAFSIPDLQEYVGKHDQVYPAYSSKTVAGKQLHELAREGKLPADMPSREVEIYAIELLNHETWNTKRVKAEIFRKIDLVKGDFRQAEIKKRWEEVLNDPDEEFQISRILVTCSSGTYMRSLADRIGADSGRGAFAFSIKRTRILNKED